MHRSMSVLRAALLLPCWVHGGDTTAPVIDSVSPSTFPVEGMSDGEYATVVGNGFQVGQAGTTVCMISSPPGTQSTTFRYGGGGYPEAPGLNISFPAQVVNTTHLRCVPPTVVVGGSGLLSVSMDNFSFSNTVPIAYTTLLDVAIGRRPYLAESTGSLLIMSSPALQGLHLSIVAKLPCANWSTIWEVDVSNTSIVLNFDFAGMPRYINNDLQVAASGIPWRNGPIVVWRRLIRHQLSSAVASIASAAESASTIPETVQVDHHIRALRVNGQPFVGQGWYVYGGFAWAQRNISMLFAPVKRQAELGIDLIVPYNLNDFNATDQHLYLDWCHAAGVKVIYPMVYFAGATNKQNYGNDWESAQWLAEVRANVSLVKSHPAILGYYICDDCCPTDANLGNSTLQAKLYSYIKEIDPLHIVAGAVQCSNLWMFSDVPAWPPAAPSAAVAAATRSGSCVPSTGSQPALQLSLDLILTENYAESLTAHAGDGTFANGPSRDGGLRNGLARAPLVNCRGLWTGSHAFADFPGSPRQTRTAMWLAVVAGEFLSEVVFLLQSTGPWLGPNTLGGGWQQTIQVAIWATQMRSLLPSFLRPFEASPHPNVNITSARPLLATASTATLPGTAHSPVRARAWVEGPCNNTHSGPSGANAGTAGLGRVETVPCIHLIVVNVLVDTAVEYTARVYGSSATALAATQALNATRLFDASYNISLVSDHGDLILHDVVPAGEANVYEIGCTGPKPHERNDGSSPPWEACANRRVLCWDRSSQC